MDMVGKNYIRNRCLIKKGIDNFVGNSWFWMDGNRCIRNRTYRRAGNRTPKTD
uniref:Uncharacterized protein n=1 Tax=Clostridium botulinum TaxID=1491 RepID=A0A140B453_CLOBO|nr:hypothetical protein [Clostridium botulinum]